MGALYSAGRSAVSLALTVVAGWEVRGRERIPPSGGLIVAANHSSYWDPPLVGSALRRELHFLAKQELFSPPLFGRLIGAFNAIPIRRGMADLSGLSRAIDLLKDGGALLVFPEGGRMRDGELHQARPGVGLLAAHADVSILPCSVLGSHRPRRWLTRRDKLRVWFGEAKPWQAFAGGGNMEPGRALYQRIGDGVMEAIATIRAKQLQCASPGAAQKPA